MARFNVGKGLDQYIRQLERATDKSPEILGQCVFDGAKIVTDQIRSQIQAIPDSGDEYVPEGKKRTGASSVEKQGLLAGLGIARMSNDGGFWNVKPGFSGKNADGTLNTTVARAINSGTSFRQAYPFISRAISASRGPAEQAIGKKLDEELQKIFGS